MYTIKHFYTDNENLYRVIYETSSIARQCFHGNKKDCEYYVSIMTNSDIMFCVKDYIRKYVDNIKQLELALK